MTTTAAIAKDTSRSDIERTRAALPFAQGLDGCTVELVGTWIWVEGMTKEHRQELKAHGYRWSPKHTKWYFRTTPHRFGRSSGKSYDEIRATHGARRIKQGAPQPLCLDAPGHHETRAYIDAGNHGDGPTIAYIVKAAQGGFLIENDARRIMAHVKTEADAHRWVSSYANQEPNP